ncbi:hypothetical protein GCM10007161_12940 [Ignatzschineria indica]|uniref:DUF459 domain-containing protein n=1 Tax=Ignatzschineria indica TaxID=472583 RepID=A0A2U2AJY8_9GAMM|nr:SGNH family hydrolase [Ignatzschineria indica]PWD83100.1 hypothetical protein DC082_06680 [Ignatzschineria indica]GGZ82920.1 hypothetical protein GCM10007161_12940 [Ignatzschineria indica]
MRAKVAYILIITVAGMLFLFRESVNTYWMQSYHQDSPLIEIERWITGKKPGFVDSSVESIVEVDEVAEVDPSLLTDQSAGQQDLAKQEIIKEVPKEAPEVEIAEVAEVEEVLVMGFVGPQFPQLPGTREVRAGDKLFFVGDSMMQGVAPRIKQALYQKEGIDGVDLSKQSTGLSYPNFYNWPKVVKETLAKDEDIRVMVVYLGANDPWDFPVPGRKQYLRFKSPEWERAYRSRIRQLLLSAKEHDIPVIWLGAPCMRKDQLHRDMIYLNRLYQEEVERFNGYYLPTSDILGCSDAGYAAHVVTDKGQQRVRANDGIHFTVAGQRMVGNRVIDLLSINSQGVLDEAEPESATESSSLEVKKAKEVKEMEGERKERKDKRSSATSSTERAEKSTLKRNTQVDRKLVDKKLADQNIAPPLQLQSTPEIELERESSSRRREKSLERATEKQVEKGAGKGSDKPIKSREIAPEVLLWEWADGSPIQPAE